MVSGAKTTGSAGSIGGCSGGSDLTSLLLISNGSMVSFVSLVSVSEKWWYVGCVTTKQKFAFIGYIFPFVVYDNCINSWYNGSPNCFATNFRFDFT